MVINILGATGLFRLRREFPCWRENRKRGTLRAKETKQGRSYLYARFARAYPKTLKKNRFPEKRRH